MQIRENVYCVESIDKSTIVNFAKLKEYVDKGECSAYTVISASGSQ